MAPVVVELYYSIVIKYTKQKKKKTLKRSSIIRDLHYADGAALVADSIEKVEESIDRFFTTSKAFGQTISIMKTVETELKKKKTKKKLAPNQGKSLKLLPTHF